MAEDLDLSAEDRSIDLWEETQKLFRSETHKSTAEAKSCLQGHYTAGEGKELDYSGEPRDFPPAVGYRACRNYALLPPGGSPGLSNILFF